MHVKIIEAKGQAVMGTQKRGGFCFSHVIQGTSKKIKTFSTLGW